MALQIWLPLDNTIKNQGIFTEVPESSNINIKSINGVPMTYFNNSYIKFSTGGYFNKEFSFSFWIYVDSLDTYSLWNWRDTAGGSIAVFIIDEQFRLDDGNQHEFSYIIPTKTLLHVALTRDASYCKLYVNGELKQSIASTDFTLPTNKIASIGCSSTKSNFGLNYLSGYLRDYRVYNHCLSASEVVELSKGLYYHYPLNQPEKDTTSELSRKGYDEIEYDVSGSINNISLISGLIPEWSSDTPKYLGCYNYNTAGNIISTTNHIKPTRNVSISAWVKATSIESVTEPSVDVDGINIYVNNAGVIHLVGTFGDLNSSVSCINTWCYVVGTYDGTTVKLYVNGELKASKAYTADLQYTKGAAISSDSKSGISCKASDFRVYLSALTESKIKDMYSVSTKVSSNSMLLTNEIVE